MSYGGERDSFPCAFSPRRSPGAPGGNHTRPACPSTSRRKTLFDEADELLVGEKRSPGVAEPERVPGLGQGPQYNLPAGFDALDVLLEAEALFAELTSQLLQSAIWSRSAVMRGWY